MLLAGRSWGAVAHGGGRLHPSRWNPYWIELRTRMGHPGLRLHNLRHTGLAQAARSGATLPDLMNRAGHTTPRAALIYLHTDDERDQVVAASMDAMVSKSREALDGSGQPV